VTDRPLRIVVADDNALLREGIASLLRSIITDTPSTPLSLFVLLAITVVSLVLAMRIIERREYVLEQ